MLTGTSSSVSGAAVTGPTHTAVTPVRNDRSIGSSQPVSLARMSIDATAGALVKLTVSSPRSTICSIIRSSAVRSSGAVHR